jgi:Ca2+-dependent lipid-binding protein
MDPYLIIEHNKKKNRTNTKKNAGKYPVWEEKFLFSLVSSEDIFTFSCYDEDLIIDDFIG